MPRLSRLLALALLILFGAPIAPAHGDDEVPGVPLDETPEEKTPSAKDAPEGAPDVERLDRIELVEMLAIGGVARGARLAVFSDAIEKQRVRGELQPPNEGDTVTVPGAEAPAAWTPWRANAKGWLTGRAFSGGYAWARVELAEASTWLLDVRGARRVWIGGAWRIGDLYSRGMTRIPVRLDAGVNHILFRLGRPRLKATLLRSDEAPRFVATDDTLPDFVRGRAEPVLGAVVLLNPSSTWLRGATVRATAEGGEAADLTVPAVPPYGFRKIGFRVAPPPAFADWPEVLPKKFDPRHPVHIELRVNDQVVAGADRRLRVRAPSMWRKETFRSAIDGSIQYYGLVPAAEVPGTDDATPSMTPGLILSTHGASVEASNQARSYKAKPWAHIVAPTNRRPFGFDWEDWGRLDALEVLARAKATLAHDPARVHLTGHSMGGHGAWILGAQFPDLFGAIAPSAGWRDFWSYGGAPSWETPTPVEALLYRTAAGSRTLLLEENYRHHGIYVLHGDADETVPVEQARFMRARLGAFHTDFAYYERPGGKHWWGNACMDWPPLMRFLEERAIPDAASVNPLRFVTVHPWISSRCHYAEVRQQSVPYTPSVLEVETDVKTGLITVTTKNVRRFSLDPQRMPVGKAEVQPAGARALRVDGQPLATEAPAPWWFVREGDAWVQAKGPADAGEKTPQRCGPFKAAFDNRMVFVVGTRGTAEETRWAAQKARFDAEQFWYRGNGSIDVVDDTAFDAAAEPDRNVILYGHRGMNAAWDKVLANSPVVAERGGLQVGDRQLAGGDLAVFFVRPRVGSDKASVGVIAGTGGPGMRVTAAVPVFLSGAAFPDWLVIGADMPTSGTGGIRGAGFFTHDWSLGEDVVWQIPVAAGRSEG